MGGLIAVSAKATTLAEVLDATLLKHPDTAIAESKIAEAKAKQLEVEGAFDWQLASNSQWRSSGYYDSWYADQRLSKQLAWRGAKLQSRYRFSGGDSPVYEAQHDTLDMGEASIKLSLPLLQGREVDSYRAKRLDAEIGLGLQQLKAQLIANELLSIVSAHYLNWYLAEQDLQISKQLLVLAEGRFSAVQTQEQIGDSSRMEVLEVEANLVARKADVAKKKQQVLLAKIYLREFVGSDLVLGTPAIEAYRAKTDIAIDDILSRHPKIRVLQKEIGRLDQQLRLGKNQLLPVVNMDVLLARDVGSGSKTLEGTESYVGVSASMPLGQRKAKGQYSVLQQKKHQLNSEREKLKLQLEAQISAELTKIDGLVAVIALNKRQVEAAEMLAEQEQVRFEARVGDLFRLNLREQSLAKARWELQKNKIDLAKAELDYLAKAGLLFSWFTT